MKVHAKSVGSRIKSRRIELGLSQRGIQTEGVSYAFISRIEGGHRKPSLSALIEIANKLDVTALYLATGNSNSKCPFCGRGTNESN